MRILYTNFHLAEGGGHTTYIRSLLRNPRHEKFVACPYGSKLFTTLKEEGFSGLEAMDFPSSIFRQAPGIVRSAARLRRFIEEKDIDIVHTNGSPDNRLAFYVSLFCRKKFKVVYTKHNSIPVRGIVSKWRLNNFNDAVILVADAILDLLGLDRDNPKYHVIENGIDIEYWKRSSPPTLPGGKIRLVSNGGTRSIKGWPHLFEALDGLDDEEKSRFSVTLLGRVWSDTEKKYSGPDARFPGFLTETRPWLEDADVGFLLSYREACSFASREMLAMGLPVITSDFPTCTTSYDPGCGWLTKRKDPKSIRRVLREILATPPEKLLEMKLAARRLAESSFSIETMIEKTDKVYDQVMGRGSGSA